mmetsp:Transcript_23875/g.55211  ORF Transcript_23875/g.55211 Transcript_23875/m.55211 type:complete len:121 (+) Transcript_23875:822-1184(+)
MRCARAPSQRRAIKLEPDLVEAGRGVGAKMVVDSARGRVREVALPRQHQLLATCAGKGGMTRQRPGSHVHVISARARTKSSRGRSRVVSSSGASETTAGTCPSQAARSSGSLSSNRHAPG